MTRRRLPVLALGLLTLVACGAQPAAPGVQQSSVGNQPDLSQLLQFWDGYDAIQYDTPPAPDCAQAPETEKDACIIAFYCDPAPAERQAACRAKAQQMLGGMR